MEISGKSIDEDSQEFWSPVVSWVKTYSLKPSTKTCLNLFIESLDTSSSTALVEVLYLLKEMMKEGNEVRVHWNYEENDLDMLEIAGISIAFNAKPIVEAAADFSIKDPSLRSVP